MIDLTVPPSDVVAIWPGGPGYSRQLFRSTMAGDISNDSVINHDLHVGTHIEAGLHRSSHGRAVSELLTSSVWLLRAQVVDARGSSVVTDQHIALISQETELAMFLTDNSENNLLFQEFTQEFVGLDPSVCSPLSKLESLKVIGSDYVSIESFHSDGSVHKNLFDGDLLALETLNLKYVEPGHYLVMLSAQILEGAEAAQCQVGILEESDAAFIKRAFEGSREHS